MPGYRQLARNRDFTLLWLGDTVSEIGAKVTGFAFPLVTYAVTGSVLGAAWVEAAFLIGWVATLLPGGAIADRYDRRRLLIGASLTGLLAAGSLAAAGIAAALTLPHLIGAALVMGVANGVMDPAQASVVRTIVDQDDLPTALSQVQARQHVAALIGGPLGGALYSVTRWLPFAVDAVSFAVSAATVRALRTNLAPPARPTATHWWSDVRDGITWMWRRPFFRVLLSWAAVNNLLGDAVFFVVFLRMITEGYDPAAIGLVSTAAGLGGIIGAAIAPYIIERLATGTLTVLIAWMSVLPLVPLIWWGSPWAVGAVTFVCLLLNPAGNAGISSYRMAITPDELQGRVSAASKFLALSVLPLSPVLGGWLLHSYDPSVAVAALICGSGLLALLPTLSRSIRSVPRPAHWPTLSA